MSYCRWSSDNGYCDAYVYQSTGGGYVTHIAGRRRPPGAPVDPHSLVRQGCSYEEFKAAENAREEWGKANPLVDIDHPESGTSFYHAGPKECADNLIRLRGEGFAIPQYAIDELLEEACHD